jgi:hypothetical protein
MKVAIMQPYLFPYIGYFQLMKAVDEFVLYDNIEFTKKGWINRNRILVNGQDAYISFPLRKDSDFLDVRDRYLAGNWETERKKLLNKISGAYRNAPFFEMVFPYIESVLMCGERNLFAFILHSLEVTREYLDINSKIIVSSTLPIEHGLRGEEKVIAICKTREATDYINPIGGITLYDRENFKRSGVGLCFIKTADIRYEQFGQEFVPSLSIIDVMMFNSKERIQEYLDSYYTLV